MNRVLNSTRLRLRAPQAGDAAHAFARWTQDETLLRYMPWRPHAALADTARQLAWDEARWLKRSAYTWMLLPHGERGPVGQLQLVPQQLDGPPHHLRLGYLLARPWQGRGLMREALAALLAHALAQPAVWRVDAVCDVDNLPSRRLLEAAGMVCEGRLARFARHPNAGAAPRDVWLHAIATDGALTPAPPPSPNKP